MSRPAGWSVCLVEANQDMSGSARTLEGTLPGFRHDLGKEYHNEKPPALAATVGEAVVS